MKGNKFILYFLIGILSFSCSKEENGTLPSKAMTIINEYYSDLSVDRIGDYEGMTYAMLSDGTEIEFTLDGDWRYVKTTIGTYIPVSSLGLVHANIRTYFEGQYKQDLKIIDSMAFDPDLGYTFRLNKEKDSLMITFDLDGSVINQGGVETPISIIMAYIKENFPDVEIRSTTSVDGTYVVALSDNVTIIFRGTGKDWLSVSHSQLLPENYVEFYLLDVTKDWLTTKYGGLDILKKIEKNSEGAFTVYTQDNTIIKFTKTGELTPDEKIKEYFEKNLPGLEIVEIKNRVVTLKNDPTTIKFNTAGTVLIGINNTYYITPNILVLSLPEAVVNQLKDSYTTDLDVFNSVIYDETEEEYTVMVIDGSKMRLKADGTILEQTLTTDQAIRLFLDDNFTNPAANYTKKAVGNTWEVTFKEGTDKVTIIFNSNASDWLNVKTTYFLDEKLVINILPAPVKNAINEFTTVVYEIGREDVNYKIIYKAKSGNSTTRIYNPEGERQ